MTASLSHLLAYTDFIFWKTLQQRICFALVSAQNAVHIVSRTLAEC